jgi:hypothetical protein
MLFNAPCCEKLQHAISVGDSQTFAVLDGALFVAIGYSEQKVDGKNELAWFHEAVFFCPFCGTELQTRDSVDEWKKREHSA